MQYRQEAARDVRNVGGPYRLYEPQQSRPGSDQGRPHKVNNSFF
ncbi:hypothetical protein PAMC26577_28275 [Caballeronia sordidicola]|uniref:Uncharacterized protein n=1 Tax=Caballeronia sordidicola TaxID=196367 RepID=A0A242MFY2_CABSO|nr:hypothetical protein PAMC26577_28275 [Caballeronia sordidicola]